MGGLNAELLAVFRNRAAGDVESAFLEQRGKLAVRERRRGILLVHQIADHLLDAAGGNFFALFRLEPAGEEIFEFKQPDGGFDVFVRHCAAHGRFMQSELVGDLLHGHRLEILDAFRKKIVLGCDEDIRYAFDRLLPLFERLHQPVSVCELVPDVRTDVVGRVRVFKHLQIELRDTQMRNVRIIVNDLEIIAVALHGHLGNDIDGFDVRNDVPGTRIELFDLGDLSVELLQGDVPRFRKLREFVARNILQMIFNKVYQFRRILSETAELENETLLEVARADSEPDG